MAFLKSRRGSQFFELMWQPLKSIFVAIVAVFLPLGAFLYGIAHSEYFERNYLAVDLSMFLDTALSSPNDLVCNYNKDTRGLSIVVDDNKLEIYRSGFDYEITGKGVSYFIRNPSIEVPQTKVVPIYDYVRDLTKPKATIPAKPLVVKTGNYFSIFNPIAEVLNE